MPTKSLRTVALLAVAAASTASAFTSIVSPAAVSTRRTRSTTTITTTPLSAESWDGTASSGGGAGQIEQIEFKIHADGRVEETVRGVKGNNCHKITEKINEALGEVIATEPTEEMYEQEVVLDQTLTQNDGESWEGGSTW